MQYRNSVSVEVRTTQYQKFKGADFSTDPTQVDGSHSPWPKNLIADEGGFPEKRPGWRTVLEATGQINGLFTFFSGGKTWWVIHHGETLSHWQGETLTTLKSGINDKKSRSFVSDGKLYLLTGREYLVVGEAEGALSCASVSENAYTPRTFIGRAPTGGGVQFEAVNLIGTKRQNDFLADGTSTVYQLDATDIDEVVSVEVNGAGLESGYTVDKAKGTVTFTTAPKKPEEAGGVAGADNVKIVYEKAADGYAERISGCTVCAQFGQGAFDRVFFSGNPEYPNLDWCSGFRDPTYIPDTSYAVIGSEESAVMGYLHIGSYLAIVKEDNQQDATVFLRSVRVAEDGTVTFPIEQGVQSIGAVSKDCFASLRDDPIFLSRYGVNAITTNNVTLERSVNRRSGLIDPKLTAESGMNEAVGCVWKDWFVLAINGVCYVADSKQKSYRSNLADNYMYEWYYWDNIPARVLKEQDGTLWFGTADGRICRFNDDIETMAKYSDDGAPIVAEWATKADDDGDFMRYKTMIRRGSGVQCKPYAHSSVKALIRTEKDFGILARTGNMSFFDFSDIDFSDFTFATSDASQTMAFNRKVRKYQTMQIIIRNDGLNQGFGIFGIIKRYRMMNYVK